jgi:predicted amidohydrolase YtcJ
MQIADTIIINASVLTMSREMPQAEAVAISGNKIIAVGSNDDIDELKGSATRTIDAVAGTVMPGFVESHMHLFMGATGRRQLQLFGVVGMQDLRNAVHAYATANPREGLLIAKGADYVMLGDDGPRTRHHLDEILPGRPLILFAPDHHTAWANTIALEKAGILAGRDVGAGNEIVMGDDGLATGELREGHAIGPIMGLRTSGGRESFGMTGTEPGADLTPSQRAADIETMNSGLQYCAAAGITNIYNMDGNFYQLELLREIEQQGELLCRTQIPFHLTNEKPLSSLKDAAEMHRTYRSDMLWSGRVKMFADGVLDSGTAVMVEDYGDQPGWRGEPLFSPEEFRRAAIEIDRLGLQISVHAIGDGAVRLVLDGYEAARDANGPRDSRHRIEHIEVIHPDDIHRFAELGVIASMQPPHPPGSMGLPLEPTVSKIGRDRWQYSYAWRTLWNAGARIAFASDWPVSAVEPMLGIHAAVTRQPWAPELPEQHATLAEALAGYTREGAYAGFKEHKTGVLNPGMQADIVVLSGDVSNTEPQELEYIHPIVTICNGQVTHDSRT